MDRTEYIAIVETDPAEFERKMNELVNRRGKIEKDTDGNSYELEVVVKSCNCGVVKLDEHAVVSWHAIVEIEREKFEAWL